MRDKLLCSQIIDHGRHYPSTVGRAHINKSNARLINISDRAQRFGMLNWIIDNAQLAFHLGIVYSPENNRPRLSRQ